MTGIHFARFRLTRLRLPVFLVTLLMAGMASSAARPAGWMEPLSQPVIAGCTVFPADNVWNVPVDDLPVHPRSADYINSIGAADHLHPDFGSGTWDGHPIGIPYNIVSGTQARLPVDFDYDDESDPGPYPIPNQPLIEGGSDRHILIIDQDQCVLYELFNARYDTDGWHAGSGAIFPLGSNDLRPAGWTSADAAGLPILPGLVRYEEVAAGEIAHALRFTVNRSHASYVWPARHLASSWTGVQYPPMGQRFRLKAGYNIAGFAPEVQVILRALKKYGMLVADNGSDWYISGTPDERWNNDILVSQFHSIPGSAFEAVAGASLMAAPDSGQATQYRFSIWLPFTNR